jgi:Na+/proline symporter
VQVQTGRLFVVLLTVMAYVIALRVPQTIFDLAVQFAFSGYASLSPLLFAALFWRRSTKWGALASTVWTAVGVIGVAAIQQAIPPPPPGVVAPVWSVFGVDVITRPAQGAMVLGFLPVVPMTLISAALMVVVSRLTAASRPGAETLARYFPS